MNDESIKDLLKILIEETRQMREEIIDLRKEAEIKNRMKAYPDHWSMKCSQDAGGD